MVATSYKVGIAPSISGSDKVVPPTKLAERLESLRKKHGYTQEDVAQRIGISQVSYRKYENGGGVESARLLALCQLYSVSADYILGLVDQPADHVEEEKLPPHERNWLRIVRSGKFPRLIRGLLDDWEFPPDEESDKPAIESGS